MKVGVLSSSVSRNAGGMYWSVRSLVREIVRLGNIVDVFSIYDEYTEQDVNEWSANKIHVFKRIGPKSFGFAPGMYKLISSNKLDVLHSHGLWMYPSIVSSRWSSSGNNKVIVSPRGMLDKWALSNSKWKKYMAGYLYENKNLQQAACIHALCDSEAEAIREFGLNNPIAVIPNGVDLPDINTNSRKPQWAKQLPMSARILLFLGRLHPKKGLKNLLYAWSQSKSKSLGNWVLVIAGWDENEHRCELERIVASLGIGNNVYFVGPQFKENKLLSLNYADAFILPSFSEGLPMAVLDAWAHKLPVIMTPECNLDEGFETGAAIRVLPNIRSLADGLDILFDLNEIQLRDMGFLGRTLVESKFTWTKVALKFCEVYRWLLDDGALPSTLRIE